MAHSPPGMGPHPHPRCHSSPVALGPQLVDWPLPFAACLSRLTAHQGPEERLLSYSYRPCFTAFSLCPSAICANLSLSPFHFSHQVLPTVGCTAPAASSATLLEQGAPAVACLPRGPPHCLLPLDAWLKMCCGLVQCSVCGHDQCESAGDSGEAAGAAAGQQAPSGSLCLPFPFFLSPAHFPLSFSLPFPLSHCLPSPLPFCLPFPLPH